MPVKVSKMDGKYRVSTPNQVHAYGTSKAKAERQARLLRAIDHGWEPTGKPTKESVHAEAQRLVDALMERDDINSLPIPASGRNYARLSGGVPALRRKQQLYINMARDLGNRGKPTHGFQNREGSEYTAECRIDPPLLEAAEGFQPDRHQIAWAQRLISMFNEGGHWVVPSSGHVYKISHAEKTLRLVEGEPSHEWHRMNKALFSAIGYTVFDGPDNPNEISFAEGMDNCPVSKPLERSRVEKTKLSGGKYGKGVESKGKTSGKFKFPSNYSVGHAMKS